LGDGRAPDPVFAGRAPGGVGEWRTRANGWVAAYAFRTRTAARPEAMTQASLAATGSATRAQLDKAPQAPFVALTGELLPESNFCEFRDCGDE